MDQIIRKLAAELGQPETYVNNVVDLMDEGNTIPFIARYRKELHGGMDDTTLRTLADRLQYLRNLDKRKAEVERSISEQGKLTEALSAALSAAATLAEVEDLYRPHKPKRRTRASMAREKGLEPLADLLFAQAPDCPEPLTAAGDYVDPELGVETAEDALSGASDIIAERISDDPELRKALRKLYETKGFLVSRAKAEEPEDTVYRLYYEFRTPVARAQGHQ
ncbi:MAG: Tex-like N-terminal domain-containing protein, partial [Clostridiales bacterium]|nr:Tex-like N-terminal domain-containing protein [Clostridiales bacterium]